MDFWAFILPAVSFAEIAILGRLIVTEILLLAMLPWLWSARESLPMPRWFVLLWAGWLISQIVTDLVAGTAFLDFARGWAAIAFTFTDFAAILVLVSAPKRARFFAFGLASSGVLSYVLAPSVFATGDPWKWAFSVPVGFTLAAGLSGSQGAKHRWPTVAAFVAFGALNLSAGFRSLGGVSLLTAGYLTLRIVYDRGQALRRPSLFRSVAVLALLAGAVAGTLQIYDAAASEGLLGADAQAKYVSQSGTLGVLIGGRSEVLASSQAVIDSPILGHGSWAKDLTYVSLLNNRLDSLGYELGAQGGDLGLIPAHSYLMQSWVWAGLLGGLFWLAVLGIALRLLLDPLSLRLNLAPLIVFSTMLLVWNIAFSPYGFSARMSASYGIALCLLGIRLMRVAKVDDSPARSQRDPSRFSQSRSGGPANSWRAARNVRSAPDQPASRA